LTRTWKDKRHETLRAKLPNGKVQRLLAERDPVAKVVKILSRITDDTLIEKADQHVHDNLCGYSQTAERHLP